MDKELIDRVWACLPREFKEEVKKYYLTLHKQYLDYTELHFDNARVKVQERMITLEYLFGNHNLTSDAEGEELLTVPRSKVMKEHAEARSKMDNAWWQGYMIALQELFGFKCLPDEEHPKQKDCDNPLADKEGCKWRNDGKCAFGSACYYEPLNPQEPKPAEPKLKVGDIVQIRYSEHCYSTPQVIKDVHFYNGIVEYQIGTVWAKESILNRILRDEK